VTKWEERIEKNEQERIGVEGKDGWRGRCRMMARARRGIKGGMGGRRARAEQGNEIKEQARAETQGRGEWEGPRRGGCNRCNRKNRFLREGVCVWKNFLRERKDLTTRRKVLTKRREDLTTKGEDLTTKRTKKKHYHEGHKGKTLPRRTQRKNITTKGTKRQAVQEDREETQRGWRSRKIAKDAKGDK
jgi:hypothetical protein